MTAPNLVIFRVPVQPHHETHSFAQVQIIDGVLQQNGEHFTVPTGDPYENMEFSNITFAEKTEDGSMDIFHFNVNSSKDDTPAVVHTLSHDTVAEIVAAVLKGYDE